MATRRQDNSSDQCKADVREKVREKERDVMKEAADNLASVKNTLAAIDDLSKRWEVAKPTLDLCHVFSILPEFLDY